MLTRLLTLGVAGLALLVPAASDAVTTDASGGALGGRVASASERIETRPLAGRTIVLDPGHQLGNARHLRQINRLVPAGPHRKPCNTTGTSTNDGYPEATRTWQVAQLVRSSLERAG